MNFYIKKISHAFDEEIQATIDGKTKPLGALGQLEDTAKSIARVQLSSSNNNNKSLSVNKPNLFIFAPTPHLTTLLPHTHHITPPHTTSLLTTPLIRI